MKNYLGQSEWKKRQPKVKTSWWTLSILIIGFIIVLWSLYVVWWGQNNYVVCPPQGCTVEAHIPEYGTKAWFTMCYNQYDTYEDRINLCG